ncbi:MAG: PAS domain S-box protein [Candidatus Thorarchaeota archaeon]
MIEVEDNREFSDDKFKLISENINELISIIDINQKIEFINKIPYLKKLGYHEKDLIGKSWLNLVHPGDLENIRNTLKINAKRKNIIKEIRVKNKKGTYHQFLLGVRAFVDYNKTIKFMLFLSDIYEIKNKVRFKNKIEETEDKFRNITEQSLMGIIILQDNKIKYINNTAAQIVDYTPEELLYLPPMGFVDLIHPEDRKMVIQQAKKRQKGVKSKITGYECRCFKKNGDLIWIQTYSKTIIYNNKFADLVVIIDITDKKRAEIRLKESEKRLKYLLSSSTTIIYTINPSRNNKFTFVSENVKEIMGYNPEDFINNPEFWISNVHPIDRQVIQSKLSRLSENENLGFIYRFRLWNGLYHWIRDEIKLVRDVKGNILELLGTWADITINKRIEEKVQFQAKLVDEISDAIISTDLNFNIITWNNAAESIYGWEAEETKRKYIYDIIPVQYPTDDKDDVLNLLLEKGDWKGEIIQQRKDNQPINILTSINMIKNVDGKLIGTVAINRDITERKLVENKLKESEEKFRTIAEQSILGISIIQKGSIIFVNQAVSNILEYSLEEIKNWSLKDIFKLIQGEDLYYVLKKLKERNKDDYQSILQFQCRIFTKFKKSKWVDILLKSLVYQGKTAIILSLIDITGKIEVEEELREISKLKSELLNRASHELKTPLVAIKGYTDLLLNPRLYNYNFQAISIIEEIRQGCKRMEEIIKDLLTVSKLKSSYFELNKSEEDLSFLIRFCVKNVQGFAKSRNHTILLNIQDKMVTMFEKERIYEVILNLLNNAINYTPPNGLIKIKSQTKKGFYVISIEDNGIGFTSQEKFKIFKKFGKIERYGQGMDIFSEGFGLGLYISKKIVKLHGGEIWVESRGKNEGSTFSFSLPIINRIDAKL